MADNATHWWDSVESWMVTVSIAGTSALTALGWKAIRWGFRLDALERRVKSTEEMAQQISEMHDAILVIETVVAEREN